MKKGCFVKIIIVLTIVLAVVLFLLQNYFDDIILKPGEKFIKGIVFNGLNKEMEDVKESPEKDSLRVLMDNFVHRKLTAHEEIKVNSEELESLIDSVKTAFEDSLVTWDEIDKIKKWFEKN